MGCSLIRDRGWRPTENGLTSGAGVYISLRAPCQQHFRACGICRTGQPGGNHWKFAREFAYNREIEQSQPVLRTMRPPRIRVQAAQNLEES
jgi:hypothetical protein